MDNDALLTDFDIEQTLGFRIAKARRRLYARFRDAFAPYGLTPPQFGIYARLWKKDGVSQKELSTWSEMDRTTVCGVIDRLTTAGLVERRPHPDDRRAYLIYLTDQGRALQPEIAEVARKTQATFSSRMTPEEFETLNLLLDKIRI
jgi:DNA-binding MarR family transcriptional regulator